jgi:hypothetical protein
LKEALVDDPSAGFVPDVPVAEPSLEEENVGRRKYTEEKVDGLPRVRVRGGAVARAE